MIGLKSGRFQKGHVRNLRLILFGQLKELLDTTESIPFGNDRIGLYNGYRYVYEMARTLYVQ